MASGNFPPPPTYAPVFLLGADGKMTFNQLWQQWFIDLQFLQNSLNQGITTSITSANLTGKTITVTGGVITNFA